MSDMQEILRDERLDTLERALDKQRTNAVCREMSEVADRLFMPGMLLLLAGLIMAFLAGSQAASWEALLFGWALGASLGLLVATIILRLRCRKLLKRALEE